MARQTPDAHLITEERKRKNYAEFWNVIPVTEPYRCVLSEVRCVPVPPRACQPADCARLLVRWLILRTRVQH